MLLKLFYNYDFLSVLKHLYSSVKIYFKILLKLFYNYDFISVLKCPASVRTCFKILLKLY